MDLLGDHVRHLLGDRSVHTHVPHGLPRVFPWPGERGEESVGVDGPEEASYVGETFRQGSKGG